LGRYEKTPLAGFLYLPVGYFRVEGFFEVGSVHQAPQLNLGYHLSAREARSSLYRFALDRIVFPTFAQESSKVEIRRLGKTPKSPAIKKLGAERPSKNP
jgi:hypothetical protein